jgi:hypothetical protein
VLLLKLAGREGGWTVRALAVETTIPKSVVQRSLKRLAAAGLVDERRQRANLSQSEEFLTHAVKYLWPASPGGLTCGVPAAWAAPPLSDELVTDDLPPVWPEPDGTVRGLALPPIHESAVEAARRDPELAQRLALIDTLRAGDARARGIAARLLVERLGATVS